MADQILSSLGWKLREGPADIYSKLVVTSGTPAKITELLGHVTAEELLVAKPKSSAYAEALLAGLWLWHDGLEECHRIVQGSTDSAATPTYSFWHAIMHRREGDFSNSKYWYARAAGHPVLQSLQAKAGPIVNQAPADKTLLRLTTGAWNPNAFVDFVESIDGNENNPLHEIAVELQRTEWTALFEHCARLA
jgi:hypothetical protein